VLCNERAPHPYRATGPVRCPAAARSRQTSGTLGTVSPARPRRAVLRTAAASCALLLTAAVTAACSRDGGTPAAGSTSPVAPADAAGLLRAARTQLDAAPALHFSLTSTGVPASASTLLAGEGDVARPDRFSGTLDVRAGGQAVTVTVVSVGGTVYAQLLSAGFSKVDPAQFGLNDPGTLLSGDRGLTRLLADATKVRLGERTRAGAEVLQQIEADIPGSTVATVLTSADPATPVTAVFGLVEGSGQLRRATLTGPFQVKDTPSTYTVLLTRYGQPVTITAPPVR